MKRFARNTMYITLLCLDSNSREQVLIDITSFLVQIADRNCDLYVSTEEFCRWVAMAPSGLLVARAPTIAEDFARATNAEAQLEKAAT